MTQQLYEIRDYRPEDRAFVTSTFLKGLYYGDSWFSLIEKTSFMHNYSKVIEALIDKQAQVKVACLKDDSDVILGYSILSPNHRVIHFVFVKARWRKIGIARSLIPPKPIAITHLTKLGLSLLTKLDGCVFDPFKI